MRDTVRSTTEDEAVMRVGDAPPPADAAEPVLAAPASLRARMGGYVVDMVILSAVAMVVAVLAGFFLLLATDFANDRDAQDSDMYIAATTLLVGTAGGWTVLNLVLLSTRRQTGGQYVAGLRVAREDGSPLSLRDAVVWWFAGNPVLYSWPIACSAGVGLLMITALSPGDVLLFVSFLVLALCAVMPIVAFVAAIFDHRNRGLHDRIAGTIVVAG